MIFQNEVMLALIIHPCRRRNRNGYGLELYMNPLAHVSPLVTVPELPKDIAEICLANVVVTGWGNEVSWDVLPEILAALIEANVPHVEQ